MAGAEEGMGDERGESKGESRVSIWMIVVFFGFLKGE
jgi:hypothetical protein